MNTIFLALALFFTILLLKIITSSKNKAGCGCNKKKIA